MVSKRATKVRVLNLPMNKTGYVKKATIRGRSAALCLCLVATASQCFSADCSSGSFRIRGSVLDPDGAAVAHSILLFDLVQRGETDRRGEFVTGCLAKGPHQIEVSAPGFQPIRIVARAEESGKHLDLHLKIEVVQQEVQADSSDPLNDDDSSGSQKLTAADLREMADDPDELARELQVLAAAAGGTPGQAIIKVDGFQGAGKLPPKSSMSLVRINPDLFSAEYQDPPYQGGLIEVSTKPGGSGFHGALFTSQSNSWMNARDPLATSRAAINRQRFGLEAGGPIRTNKADFFAALEHRQIDQFAVVDAWIVDSNDNEVPTIESVPTPQSRWEGSLRFGWLLTPKNSLTLSYVANASGMSNMGSGGIVLQEAGFDSVSAEHVVHLSNVQTISQSVVHESRIGYTWRYTKDTPNSVGPSLEVAGAFTGGGSQTQFTQMHERDLEVDDDIIYSHGKHMVKAGVELMDIDQHDTLPVNFNGTYIFAGGEAPVLGGSGSTPITGLDQYLRAILSEAGGTPTAFTATTGRASMSLNQVRIALYAEDQYKVKRGLQLSLGARWQMQDAPWTLGNIAPRLGMSWSPDRAQRWVFHLRSGLFFSPVSAATTLEAYRLGGTIQQQKLVYAPPFSDSVQGAGTVLSQSGSDQITTIRSPLAGIAQTPSVQSHLGVEHVFPGHWHTQANLYLVRAWDVLRSRDMNPPLNGSPYGPRTGPTNENIEQYQGSGMQHGNVLFLGVDQHGMKRLQLFAGYIRSDLRGDADSDNFFPQSSFTNTGETARPTWQSTHQLIAYSTLKPFLGIVLTTQFNSASGKPYNITTGLDNYGDGLFNERPYYAANNGGATAVYETPFGHLSPTGSGPTIGRNAGTLPWSVHLDLNLSRTFRWDSSNAQKTRSVSANLRSANLLNHENVTAVGGILGSPLFLQPYTEGPGRRIEVGLRFEF